MRAGLARRLDDGAGIGRVGQAGDVLGYGAVEQADPLRQVADIGAQHVRVILIQRRAIQPDPARGGRPDAAKRARQRRFARPRRPDHAQRLTGFQPKRQAAQAGHGLTRRHDDKLMRLQHRARARQGRAGGIGRRLAQQQRQPRPAVLRALRQCPLADRLFDRRQRPAHQDRRGDHRACRQLTAQHQPGPQRQHRRLQEQPHRARKRGKPAADIGQPHPGIQRPPTRLLPARKARLLHTQGADMFCLLAQMVGDSVGHNARLRRLRACPPRRPLVHKGRRHQNPAARQRQQAKRRVEQEHCGQKHRGPGHVDDREQHGRGHEPLHRIQIAQARGGHRIAGGQGRARLHGGINPALQRALESRRCARHHPAPRMIQKAHRHEQEHHQREQRSQRFDRPAAQHPVIDLQHEQRPRQHQKVHAGRKQHDRRDQPGDPRPCRAQLRPTHRHIGLLTAHRGPPLVADPPVSGAIALKIPPRRLQAGGRVPIPRDNSRPSLGWRH